jgi:putative tricarboxylic transport membrane protein
MKRKEWLLSLTAYIAAFLCFTPVWAQNYKPSRPVVIVVHSAPGGGSDVFARAVVEMVEKEKLLPQTLQVVNKTVGASPEAVAYLVEKRGDDHTIGIFTNTWVATLTSKEKPDTRSRI